MIRKKIEAHESLKLQNDGTLELVFLGVGSAFAKRHHQTNFLIVKGNDHVLVDFGMTGPRAAEDVRLDLGEVRVILPTHSHADHVGGIEHLALLNRYVGRRLQKRPKLAMVITEEYQRILWDYSLRGGLEHNETGESGSPTLHFGDFFDVIRPHWVTHQPREVYRVRVGSIELEMFRTKHIPEQSASWEASFLSYGLLIDGRVFVSCDSRLDLELLTLYEKAEVMFHDVQFFPGAVHAPLEDLKRLPEDTKRKMLLIHYADNWEAQDVAGFQGFALQGHRYLFPAV